MRTSPGIDTNLLKHNWRKKNGVISHRHCRRRRSLMLTFLLVILIVMEATTQPSLGGAVEARDANTHTQKHNTQPYVSKRNHHAQKICSTIPRGGANRFIPDNNNDNNEPMRNAAIRGNNFIGNSKGIERETKHSPVVYQYFGKSRSRGGGHSHNDDASMNFILLGPNVEHWKTVGQTLASRGFNVMACERMMNKDGEDGNPNNYNAGSQYEDAPELVLEILDALKWNRAVLVGCDDESLVAMETAMILAPERVAGLILCGDLTESNRFAMEAGGFNVLDSFLHRALDCPFVIVWDGGLRKIVSGHSAHDALERTSSPFDDDSVDGRCVILGGGSAPHRTKPEYFAWVLARFVEEKLEYHPTGYIGDKRRQTTPDSSVKKNALMKGGLNRGILRNLNLPFGIDSVVSPEGRLLLGRAVAAAIIYTSCMKVMIVQYGVLRAGLISVKNSADSVDALRRKIFQVTGAFIVNFGYIPRLFKLSFKRAEDVDDDGIGGRDNMITPNDEIEDDESFVDSQTEGFDEGDTEDSQKNDEDDGGDNNEDGLRIKPLFFLDNIFT